MSNKQRAIDRLAELEEEADSLRKIIENWSEKNDEEDEGDDYDDDLCFENCPNYGNWSHHENRVVNKCNVCGKHCN